VVLIAVAVFFSSYCVIPQMPEANKLHTAPEKPVVMSGTRARAGVIRHRMSFVLVISTVSAFVVLALLYLYYFGWPFGSGGSSGG
jgi:hypothetical protein